MGAPNTGKVIDRRRVKISFMTWIELYLNNFGENWQVLRLKTDISMTLVRDPAALSCVTR